MNMETFQMLNRLQVLSVPVDGGIGFVIADRLQSRPKNAEEVTLTTI